MPGDAERLIDKIRIAAPRVVTVAGAVAMLNEGVLIINKTVGAATAVTLTPRPTAGDVLFIKDGKGDAGANPITLTPYAAGTIDGAASLVIGENYGAVMLVFNGTEWNAIGQTRGGGAELVAGTNVLTAGESGRTFFLNLVGGFTTTLPAPAAGLSFRFIVSIAPTTSYIIVTSGGANLMYGMMEERAGGAGVAGAARDTFNFVGGQAKIGDWVDFHSDGVNWYYRGMVDIAAGNTVAAT